MHQSSEPLNPEEEALSWQSEVNELLRDLVGLGRILIIFLGALLASMAVKFVYGGEQLPVLVSLIDTVAQVGFFIGALTQLVFILARFVRSVRLFFSVLFMNEGLHGENT